MSSATLMRLNQTDE